MIELIKNEQVIDGETGQVRARREFEGTKAEREAYTSTHVDKLKDGDEWWETDTHKLKTYNASTAAWVPADE